MKIKRNRNLYLLSFILIIMALLLLLQLMGFGIVYQETDSMPKGWYLQLPVTKIYRNQIVIFQPTKYLQHYMIKHDWIGKNMRMMKHVLALPGDNVCNKNNTLLINQHLIGKVYHHYSPHHLLLQRQFCGHLAKNQYLVISTFSPRSFDSRYFGPISRQQIQYQGIKL